MENNTSCNLAINEFKSIQYNENEIILANSKKEEQLIVLSIVEKVYIKRCRLNLISKLLLVAMSLCLTLFLMAYFSIEIVGNLIIGFDSLVKQIYFNFINKINVFLFFAFVKNFPV